LNTEIYQKEKKRSSGFKKKNQKLFIPEQVEKNFDKSYNVSIKGR